MSIMDLERVVNKAKKAAQGSHTPCGPITWVWGKEDLKALVKAIHESSEIVMDLETTGLDEYAEAGGDTNGGYPARIVLASLTLPSAGRAEAGAYDWRAFDGEQPMTYLVPLSHPASPLLGSWRKVMALIGREINRSGRPFVNANIKFDARWVFAQTGVDLSDRIEWDTTVSSQLVDTEARTRLKIRAARDFGIDEWDDFDLSTPGAAERVDLIQLGEYAARDTYYTWKIEQEHREQMFLTGDEEPFDSDDIQMARLGKVATYVSMPTVRTLTKVEQRGFLLDVDWVHAKIEEMDSLRLKACEDILGLYGTAPAPAPAKDGVTTAATSKWFQGFVAQAIEAGDLRVTARTDSGNAQWNKAVLIAQQRQGSPAADALLRHRDATKTLEFLRSWLELRDPNNVIHATYNVGFVKTGRLSSSNPNVQQISARLKPAFIPRPGHVLLDLDYSQVELRVAAFISRSAPMIEAFQRGDDLHRLLAAKIAGKAPEDVTSLERKRAKAGNFGLLYGMSAAGFQTYAATAYDVAMSLDEAQRVHDSFFEMWDGMRQWHERAKRRAYERGYVTSPIGRTQWLSDLYSKSSFKASHAERNALNSPVQGFGSDLMQMAAASIMGTLPGYPLPRVEGAHVVATVHDEICIEVPEDRWQEILVECKRRMEDVNTFLRPLDCQMDVPIVAGPSAGTRWGVHDLHEEDDPLPTV
ncbi:DNA polymerase [uncultured Actinomyces sp.]|uniref:DNA polymerase n=1 Tax=uncultured Actinomyces sp. TaxID=249061 RepID=UPI0028044698|nr:DNA polymerase [uncultured Actinomyces sp.]